MGENFPQRMIKLSHRFLPLPNSIDIRLITVDDKAKWKKKMIAFFN